MSSGAGSHQNSGTSSASTFLSTLIPVALISSAILAVFLIFRNRPSTSRFGWIADFRSLSDDYILDHSSLDNYLFLRLFKVLTVICFVGALITWPILFPVYATGGAVPKQTQFDVLSMSNVKNVNRYYATVFVSWIFLSFVMLVITRETILFINTRQSVLLSPSYRSRLSTKTVLFTTVPESLRNEASMRELFSGVRRVWEQPDIKELTDLVQDRDKAAAKLEAAENKMCITLVKNRKKAEKKGKTDDIPLVDNERSHVEVNKKDRPTHRLKFLIGKKVDTIDWARPEIQSLTEKINATAGRVNKADKVPAIFVEFESLEAAQVAFRQISTQKKREMTPKVLGVQPDDVIWKNLGNKNSKNKIILAGATTFVTLMIIFWAIPVAFVGAISNIGYLETISFLTWIASIPKVILGVITGLLPAVLLAVLMALVPIVLRLLAGLFEPTRSAVELKTQSWYFAFQVVDVFLVTTFSSGASAVAKQIVQNPATAPTLLASNLPKASNFYTAYFVVTMLQQSAMTVLNVAPLLFALVLGKILDKTPRKVYNRYTSLIGLGWGSVYPAYAMLGCIAIAYSCIAPLLLGFATIGFGLLYLAYRYQLFYVIGNHSIDMKGRAYARALQQLTVGVYLAEFCLVGLFAIGISKSAASTGPLILMIIFTVATIVYHVIMRKTLGPLIDGYELVPGTEGQSVPTKKLSMADTEDGNGPGKDHTTHNATEAAPVGGIRGKLLRFFFHTQLAYKYFYPKKELAPHFGESIRGYSEQEYDEAYLPPAIIKQVQTIWIARDEYGLSRQEVAGCEQFNIPASDAEATLDEKAKVQWNRDRIREAPVYEEEVYY
ncbi:hypothetical protein MBLNU459_g6375t2 [Dothideomycetes sp. NU459]